MTHDDVVANFEPSRDNGADFTVFLAGSFSYERGEIIAATYHPNKSGSWVTAMPDHPKRGHDVKSDQFMLVLAHELSHAIHNDPNATGGTHFCEAGFLRSRGVETTKIDDLLRQLLIMRGGLVPVGAVCP
jgi:hypothetical protein